MSRLIMRHLNRELFKTLVHPKIYRYQENALILEVKTIKF